jgi:hypothetical protein
MYGGQIDDLPTHAIPAKAGPPITFAQQPEV